MFSFRRMKPKAKKRLLICTGIVALSGTFVTSLVWYTMGPIHRTSRPMAYVTAVTDVKGEVVLPEGTGGGGTAADDSATPKISSGASSISAAPEPASLMLLAPAALLLTEKSVPAALADSVMNIQE